MYLFAIAYLYNKSTFDNIQMYMHQVKLININIQICFCHFHTGQPHYNTCLRFMETEHVISEPCYTEVIYSKYMQNFGSHDMPMLNCTIVRRIIMRLNCTHTTYRLTCCTRKKRIRLLYNFRRFINTCP